MLCKIGQSASAIDILQEVVNVQQPIENRTLLELGGEGACALDVRLFTPLPSPFTLQPPHPLFFPLQQHTSNR